MAKRKPILPDYGTVQIKGKTYYRTRVSDDEGNRISLYGQPLTYTQFQRLWTYIKTRTAKPRKAKKFVGGKYVKYTIYPVLGEKARNNGKVVYSLDFEVTPHQLRHTYITNLIYASVDPKTVQYLAGHENSKITMDIYAKAKYNRPKDVAPMLEHVFNQWNGMTTK